MDYLTWENAYEPGETRVAGLPVRRFPVARRRTPEGFDELSSKVHFFDHSNDEERRWIEEHGPVTPGLLRHLETRGGLWYNEPRCSRKPWPTSRTTYSPL